MSKPKGLTSFICWIFISTVFLSSMQVTLVGLRSGDDSLFNMITLLIAEEENEDSEKNEEESSNKDHWFYNDIVAFATIEASCFSWIMDDPDYNHVFREVISPPPKA